MVGFITDDGEYGVIPYAKKWMVIYHNQQLEVFNTPTQCKKYIKTHMAANLQSVPAPSLIEKKSTRVKTTSNKQIRK
jgi:hypothetical protein